MMALVLGGQGAVPAGAPVPMRPVSTWNLEYATELCVLSRRFGDPANPITVGFRPTPFGDNVQTVVFGSRALLGSGERVTVDVGQGDAAPTGAVDGVRSRLPDGRTMGVTFDLPRDAVHALAGAKRVEFRMTGAKPIVVSLALTQAALARLKACETDLMVSWGFDPAKLAAAAVPAGVPPRGNPAAWITEDDYPTSKLGSSALVVIAWAISTTGHVQNCRAVRSSGMPEFDLAACAAITKRGRYTPARDAAGNPVESYASRRVRFQSGM